MRKAAEEEREQAAKMQYAEQMERAAAAAEQRAQEVASARRCEFAALLPFSSILLDVGLFYLSQVSAGAAVAAAGRSRAV